MTLSHLNAYDRSGAQAALNGARIGGPSQPLGGISPEIEPPVGPPGVMPNQTIDVRPTTRQATPEGAQVKQDFSTLVEAVQGGNLIGARAALESLQGHSPGLYEKSGRPSNAGSPFSNELDQMMTALKSGDEAGAKSALARLEKEMQAAHDRHRATENPLAGGLAVIGQPDNGNGVGDRNRAAAADKEIKAA